MTRFERTTRILILVLWGLAFVFFLLMPLLTQDLLYAEMNDILQGRYREDFRSWISSLFFVNVWGAFTAVLVLGVCVILGRGALAQAFRELSYLQFSILTLGMAFALVALRTELFSPQAFAIGLPPRGEERAFMSGLHMMSVFVPSAVAAIAGGWPWRLVARSGLVSSTCACIAYIVWSYFFAIASFLWRPQGLFL